MQGKVGKEGLDRISKGSAISFFYKLRGILGDAFDAVIGKKK
jgi:hypothetical protein